jgi:hypothetical protein
VRFLIARLIPCEGISALAKEMGEPIGCPGRQPADEQGLSRRFLSVYAGEMALDRVEDHER